MSLDEELAQQLGEVEGGRGLSVSCGTGRDATSFRYLFSGHPADQWELYPDSVSLVVWTEELAHGSASCPALCLCLCLSVLSVTVLKH